MNRRNIVCFVFLALSFLFASAGEIFAQLPLPMKSWSVGGHLSHIKYEEPGLMQEVGFLVGVDVSYTDRNIFLSRIEGRLSYGLMDYSSPVSGTKDGIDDFLFELRSLLGYEINTATAVFTPYIGFGYRFLYDDLRGTTSKGAVGYRRRSSYLYMPIGMEVLTTFTNNWSVALVIEYDYFLYGVQRTYLSDTGFGWGDILNNQDQGYGYRSSLKFYKEESGSYYLIEPYFIYWDIEDSDLVPIPGSGGSYGMEPANNSTEIGLKLGYIF